MKTQKHAQHAHRDVSPTPNRSQSRRDSRNPVTLIEEAVVNLHALAHYHSNELTIEEVAFISRAKANLAKMHRRLS